MEPVSGNCIFGTGWSVIKQPCRKSSSCCSKNVPKFQGSNLWASLLQISICAVHRVTPQVFQAQINQSYVWREFYIHTCQTAWWKRWCNHVNPWAHVFSLKCKKHLPMDAVFMKRLWCKWKETREKDIHCNLWNHTEHMDLWAQSQHWGHSGHHSQSFKVTSPTRRTLHAPQSEEIVHIRIHKEPKWRTKTSLGLTSWGLA